MIVVFENKEDELIAKCLTLHNIPWKQYLFMDILLHLFDK